MQASYRTLCCFFLLTTIHALPALAQQGIKLLPENVFSERFGQWVAIDSDVVAVLGNVSQHPVNNISLPVVSVFRYNGTSWAFEANLFSEDAFSDNHIRDAIAIDGDRIAVGAADVAAGSVVFFEYDGSQWVEQGQVFHTSTTSSFDDNFGSKVSLSGNQMAVPNIREREGVGNLETLPQLTYLYQHDGTVWQPADTVRVSNDANGTAFGAAVASSDDLVIIGDPLYSTSGTSREGTAYVYEYDGTNWSFLQQLDAGPDNEPDDRLGSSIATDGNTIAVGAIREQVAGIARAGAVYVFTKQGGQWVVSGRLTASEQAEDDNFGTSVAIDGTDMIVGAPSRFHPALTNAGGAAYYFKFDGTSWIEQARITLPDAASNDQFGWSVDVDNGWAVIGAYNKDLGGGARGETYVYKLEDLVSTNVANTLEAPITPGVTASVYPNPFYQQTTIQLELSHTEWVHIGVYDALGRRVDLLTDAVLTAGKHNIAWQNNKHAPGVYFFRVTTRSATQVVTGLVPR